MTTNRGRVVFGLIGICLMALGCQTEQAGVVNRAGAIRATLAAKPAAVTEAAKVVLEEMDLIVISASSSATEGRVVARTTQDVKASVDSWRVGDGVSKLSIRVGKVGDVDLSLTILDEIKDELGIEADEIDAVEDEADDDDDDDADQDEQEADGK
jgi:uncharacterized protein DUF3568